MKTRAGFVSNSSSSSFVLAITKENYDKCLPQLSDYHQAVLKHLAETDKFLGRDLVVFSDMSNAGDGSTLRYKMENFTFDGEIPTDKWGEELSANTIVITLSVLANETPDEVFEYEICDG